MKYPLHLNEQQAAFVRHREGPAALLAVPGSGKTTTMVCRTAALIQSGVPAERILTMTFTKAAALDMTRRYAELYGRMAETGASDRESLVHAGHLAHFSTIHSFSLHVVKHYCRRRNRPMPVILAESGPRTDAAGNPTRTAILSDLYREIVGGRIGEDTLESLSMGISLAKNTMADPQKASASLERGIRGFGQIFRSYEQYKKDRRLIDFDDMLTVCHRILSMDAGILEEIRSRYDFVQVDEAQDSSLIQHEIIDLVARPKNNIVLIGDEDQSIYVWRGAHPSGLLGFSKRYPGAKVFLMETNYRSRAPIVQLADLFIRRNTERTVKNLVAGFTPPSAKNPVVKGTEACIQIRRVKGISEQYGLIRRELDQRHSTAILYRNNRSAYGLADMLDREGIAFSLRDFKDTLFNHWVTRDIRAFLSLMLDPTDRDAFFLVAGRMNAYLSREILEQIKTLPPNGSIFAQIRKAALLPNFQRMRLEEVEQRFRRLVKLKPYDAIIGLLDCVSYDNAIEFASRTQGYSPDFLEGLIDTLLGIAAHQPGIPAFLARLDALRGVLEDAKAPERRRSGLTLSTVHSAKGLEFDRVFLVDMVEGEFPSGDTEETGAGAEEERRLCYVAITRARHDLQVLVPLKWGRKKAEPSRFVREMESALRTDPPHSEPA